MTIFFIFNLLSVLDCVLLSTALLIQNPGSSSFYLTSHQLSYFKLKSDPLLLCSSPYFSNTHLLHRVLYLDVTISVSGFHKSFFSIRLKKSIALALEYIQCFVLLFASTTGCSLSESKGRQLGILDNFS